MTRIIASAYPNGEVRVVICPDRRAAEGKEEGLRPNLTLAPNSEPEGIQPRHSDDPPVRAGFGGAPQPTRFGKNARRTLLRAGGALDREGIPKRELVFLTGTLPGSTDQSYSALSCYSSYVIDLLKSKISKLGCKETFSLYCWELQKRGALHLHYCLHVPDEDTRNLLITSFKKMWEQIIDAVGRKAGVDMWEKRGGGTWKDDKHVLQAYAQEVTKGVGQYLAKYLSKEANPNGGNAYGENKYMGPVRWWGVSRPLLQLIEKHTRRIEVASISIYKIRYIREEMLSILDGMDATIQRYTDKAGIAEVFVSYSQENSNAVYNRVAQFISPRGKELLIGVECYEDGYTDKGHGVDNRVPQNQKENQGEPVNGSDGRHNHGLRASESPPEVSQLNLFHL